MASAKLSRRVEKVVGYPPLCEMVEPQRRESHEALLEADSFEDLPAAILRAEQNRPKLRVVNETRRPTAAAPRLRAHSLGRDTRGHTCALTSGGFMSYGKPGPGRHVTIYAHRNHAFMLVDGRRYDTTAIRETGSRWTWTPRSTRGFVARHPPGL